MQTYVLEVFERRFFGRMTREIAVRTIYAETAQFERMNRVHLNTLEQLIVFIPALWMHAYFANPIYGAILGAIFIIGRFVYRAEYLKDPDSRSLGFGMTFIPSVVLLIWTLVVVVMTLV